MSGLTISRGLNDSLGFSPRTYLNANAGLSSERITTDQSLTDGAFSLANISLGELALSEGNGAIMPIALTDGAFLGANMALCEGALAEAASVET